MSAKCNHESSKISPTPALDVRCSFFDNEWSMRTEESTSHRTLPLSGAYSVSLKSQSFEGDTPKKWTTPKSKFPKFTDSDKQIVYIGVTDPAEYESGRIFELETSSLSFWLFFVENLKKISKTSGSDCQTNTPLPIIICASHFKTIVYRWFEVK